MHMLSLKLRLILRLQDKLACVQVTHTHTSLDCTVTVHWSTYSLECTYAQVSEFLRFNGPARSTDSAALSSDLKIMNMILKSKSNSSSSNSNSSGNSSSSSADQTVHLNGHVNSTEINSSTSNGKADKDISSSAESAGVKVEKEVARFSLSSKCLVEQLPNTLSVSFRGWSCPLPLCPLPSPLISSLFLSCFAVVCYPVSSSSNAICDVKKSQARYFAHH